MELARRLGQVLTREVLLARCGTTSSSDLRLVDVAVQRLASDRGRSGLAVAISTVRGVGYRLEQR